MSFEDDLHRIEEHVAEARRLVHGKGPHNPFAGGGRGHMDAQEILSLLESNLRRFEEYERLRLRANIQAVKSARFICANRIWGLSVFQLICGLNTHGGDAPIRGL